MKRTLLFILIASALFLSACNTDTPSEEDCNFDIQAWCGGGYSFSIVNADTYENLVGDGRLINPDKIVVTNTRIDTMIILPLKLSDGWYSIENFNPFDEITCFDQCKSDSAFTRTYYLNYGGADTDTMEVFFAVRDDEPQVSFNQLSGNVPNDIDDSLGRGRSLYWFRKKIN